MGESEGGGGNGALLCKLPLQFELDQEEQEVVQHFTSQARRGKEVNFDDLSSKLDSCKEPFLMLIKLCCQPVSAAGSENKSREMASGLVLGFERYVAERPELKGPDTTVQDMAFQLFMFKQRSLPVIQSVFISFGLVGCRRYGEAVRDIIRLRRDYRKGCTAAIALQLFDEFPIADFCLPLLLCNSTSGMEAYLAGSPKAARELLTWLDAFHGNTVEKISDLTQAYPDVEPVGSNRFFGKPLDKMIKKYAEMFNVDPSYYPISTGKRASTELYYWVKQMFTQEEHAFTLTNWRDFIAMKVRDNEALKHQLVNNLFSFDINEAKHWNDVFGFNLFDRQESEDEDWEEEIENPKEEVKIKEVEVYVKDRNDNFEGKEIVEQWGSDDEDYHKLKLAREKVAMVDTKDGFEDFLIGMEGVSAVGVDVEFTPHIILKKVDIVQIATKTHVFLIDLDTLSTFLSEQDFARFAKAVFENKNIVKVGCGLENDLRLLAKSDITGLHSVAEHRKSVVDLGACTAQLVALLDLPGHTRGLSGFCEVLLGKPLSKVDQVSDWGRRPLRMQQMYYAALDAFVGLELYERLHQLAVEKGVSSDRLMKVLMGPPNDI